MDYTVFDPTKIAYVIINKNYFVMIVLHFSASVGHFQGIRLQRNTFIINAVQDVYI
jgi:hypothetical protein